MPQFKLNLAHFEQSDCLYSSGGQINATRITAIAVGQDDSDVVEVRARVHPSQTHDLRCDVLINGKTYYFNFTEEKVQFFKSNSNSSNSQTEHNLFKILIIV